MIASKTCPGPSSAVTIVYPQVFPRLFFGLAPGLEGSPAWTKLERERAESFEESRRGGGSWVIHYLALSPSDFLCQFTQSNAVILDILTNILIST